LLCKLRYNVDLISDKENITAARQMIGSVRRRCGLMRWENEGAIIQLLDHIYGVQCRDALISCPRLIDATTPRGSTPQH